MKKINKSEQLEKMVRVQTQGGFTLIETLVSLALVMFGVLFVCKVIVFSLDSLKKSRIRLEISQKVESYKNRLVSKPFQSPDMADGFECLEDGFYKIDRYISSISPTLKKIRFAVSYKVLTRQLIFYKSKFIQEINND